MADFIISVIFIAKTAILHYPLGVFQFFISVKKLWLLVGYCAGY